MTMASACKKVKNPCKICLGNVTQKSGIQCEGACRSWVHYKCLNFTPGKISDIKRGLIIVSCPCPDCTTNMPKEIVKDEPFSCTNAYCPANIPPKCINAQCPSNATCPPPGHNNLLATPQQELPKPHYGPCTVDTCKSTRVSPSHQQSKCCSKKNKCSSPAKSCCSGGDIKKAERVTQTKSPYPQLPCPPTPCLPPPSPPNYPQTYAQTYLPPQCPPPPCPPPPCPPRTRKPPKFQYNKNQAAKKNTAAIKAMERMCSTMGQLTSQLNNLMDKMQQALTMPQYPPTSLPQRPCPAPNYNMPTIQTNTCSLTELPCCCPGGQQGGIKDQQSMSSCPSKPPCCLQEQQDGNYEYDSEQPCYCPSNPLRRNDFYSN